MCEDSNFSSFLPTLVYCFFFFFYFSSCGGCGVVSGCGFHRHSHEDQKRSGRLCSPVVCAGSLGECLFGPSSPSKRVACLSEVELRLLFCTGVLCQRRDLPTFPPVVWVVFPHSRWYPDTRKSFQFCRSSLSVFPFAIYVFIENVV